MAAKEPFFHRGEAFIQDKIGVKAQMAHFAPRVITPELPEQHQRFYEQLAYLFVGHVDEQGNPWVSILYSQPGFIKATSCQQLNISADTTLGDPLSRSLKKGAHIGILGIDLASRRRNRLSGKINKLAAGSFDVTVDQAFGNCSKYIQSRSMRFTHNKALVPRVDSFTQLDIKTQQFIASADTFFVASHNLKGSKEKNEGVDVSHRGGVPGFIHVKDNTLTIPDYSGNQHFNTLGNFIEQPKAGLLFIDFNTHSVLMVTGSVNIIWNVENAERFLNAQRLWGFTLEKGMWLHNVLPMSWSFKSYSPFNKVLQESRNTNKDS
ncbi:MAG: FAD-binding oxidoreductase, partial [Methylococcales bacterium]|nr:FAD-binding oxidoreductase [Methylococcales bacterium]